MPPNSSTSSSSELRKLAGRLLLLLLLVFVLDRVLGAVAAAMYFRTQDGDTGGAINALLAKKSKVVILGSSRAESHYIPHVLSAELGMRVFNGGFKGSNSIYDYGVEQLVLEHFTPALIVYDFSSYAVNRTRTDPYDRLSPLYPYWRDPHVWDLIRADGFKAELPFLSHLYPFNSKIHSLLIFNVMRQRPQAQDGYDGSRAVMPDRPLAPLYAPEQDYDPQLVGYLVRLIDAAVQRGVRVVVVESPRYARGSFPLPPELRARIAAGAISFMDFDVSRYPQFADHRLFRDDSHLNQRGATEFSALLGAQLRELLAR